MLVYQTVALVCSQKLGKYVFVFIPHISVTAILSMTLGRTDLERCTKMEHWKAVSFRHRLPDSDPQIFPISIHKTKVYLPIYEWCVFLLEMITLLGTDISHPKISKGSWEDEFPFPLVAFVPLESTQLLHLLNICLLYLYIYHQKI